MTIFFFASLDDETFLKGLLLTHLHSGRLKLYTILDFLSVKCLKNLFLED